MRIWNEYYYKINCKIFQLTGKAFNLFLDKFSVSRFFHKSRKIQIAHFTLKNKSESSLIKIKVWLLKKCGIKIKMWYR